MAEKSSGRGERFIKLYRNINAAIGAGALILASVIPNPELQAGLVVVGALNIAQAGLAEVVRRMKNFKAKPRGKAMPTTA